MQRLAIFLMQKLQKDNSQHGARTHAPLLDGMLTAIMVSMFSAVTSIAFLLNRSLAPVRRKF